MNSRKVVAFYVKATLFILILAAHTPLRAEVSHDGSTTMCQYVCRDISEGCAGEVFSHDPTDNTYKPNGGRIEPGMYFACDRSVKDVDTQTRMSNKVELTSESLATKQKTHDAFVNLDWSHSITNDEYEQRDSKKQSYEGIVVHDVDKRLSADYPQVYLDTVQDNVQVFKAAGESWVTNKRTGETGAMILTRDKDGNTIDAKTGEKMLIVVKDSKWVDDYYDPYLKKKVGKMFYQVAVIPDTPEAINAYKEVDKAGKGKKVAGVSGWVNADLIRSTKLSDNGDISYPPGWCPPTEIEKSHPEATGQVESLNKQLEDAIVKTGPGEFMPSCLSKSVKAVLGTTPIDGKGRPYKVPAVEGEKDNVFHHLLNFIRPAANKKGVTEEQAEAIDAMALTIYGEVGECHAKYGPRYSMLEARVMMNRAEKCNGESPCPFIHHNTKGAGFEDNVVETAGAGSQYLTWNKSDPNSEKLMCIPNDPLEQKIFREDLEIAKEAILHPKKFMADTKEAAGLYFAISHPKDPGRCNTNVRIHKLPVDQTSCLCVKSTY